MRDIADKGLITDFDFYKSLQSAMRKSEKASSIDDRSRSRSRDQSDKRLDSH